MEVFGRKVKGVCPLTADEATTVCIKVPDEREVHVPPGAVAYKSQDGYSRCYQLPGDLPFLVSLSFC